MSKRKSAPAASTAGLSEYELLRLENIKRNEAELRRLGLHLASLTRPAQGKQAPSKVTIRHRAVPPRSRWSSRLMGKPSPNYTDGGEGGSSSSSSSSSSASPSAKRAKAASPAARKATAAAAASSSSSSSSSSAASASAAAAASASSPPNPRSIRNLNADLDHLDANFLGKIIPPMGGQVKRAVMEEACAEGSPSFSRMSGIQEWRNAVFLFVNIYGEVRKRKGTEREAV